ncbi:ATP-binding protein [Thermoactinospora rubra]|uniref:ATP-binding protein n=1 Tax=Thermoactinospora rubra TaxID=1088767 RepID=UPI000A10286D|nr:ATP-binding protein [Thermoactinospora rubra]
MTTAPKTVGEFLASTGQERAEVKVRLSKELITLLSEQLYQSPLKAIEELVVNSFDADATECHVVVPTISPGTEIGGLDVIAVYDNGVGMDQNGLTDLWRVGSSTKRNEVIKALRKRRQIGKFGIGKLATYALANRITYLTSAGAGEILAVTLSFTDFKSDPEGPESPVLLDVRAHTRESVLQAPTVVRALQAAELDPAAALDPAESWTLALLEELKDRAISLSPKKLLWVLRTAMPLTDDFKLFLNGDRVISSKADYEKVVEFTLGDLPPERIASLTSRTSMDWRVETRPAPQHYGPNAEERRALVSEQFEEGISGHVIVTRQTLYQGKSADLTRSHGFFVRVRGRLVDEDDPLFGVSPRSYETFNRFKADIDADDLDEDITAPRENVGDSDRRQVFIEVLVEVFNEARQRYLEWEKTQTKPQEYKREQERNYVAPRLVERPLADVLLSSETDEHAPGTDADDDWFYLEQPSKDNVKELAASLYDLETREPYAYRMEELGRDERMVRFEPARRTFVLNANHQLVLAFKDSPRALDLLHDVATAEALLEIYLREAGVSPHLIGDILERRDGLWRSLAQEQITSPQAIADNLRQSIASERDLEVALIVAVRALGFVAKHLGGSEHPDGLARLRDYPQGERKITLEAKSSARGKSSLGSLDFAGLAQHVKDNKASGCLLIAPDYPGGSRGDNAAAAKRAKDLRISCWTVEQLARVVEAMDKRDITARHILDIVLSAFTPEEVSEKVDQLLNDPKYPPRELAIAIVAALRELETYGPMDLPRSVDMISVELRRAGVDAPIADIRTALSALVAASHGAISFITPDRITLNTSLEEVERRVALWLQSPSSARRASTFRKEPRTPDVS